MKRSDFTITCGVQPWRRGCRQVKPPLIRRQTTTTLSHQAHQPLVPIKKDVNTAIRDLKAFLKRIAEAGKRNVVKTRHQEN